MKKYQIISLALVFVATTTAAFAWSDREQENEANLLNKAKLSLNQAVDKALSEVPGKALSAELDDEEQGSLAYIVEVVQGQQTYEVTVDALSGKIVNKSLDQIDDDDDDDREDRD